MPLNKDTEIEGFYKYVNVFTHYKQLWNQDVIFFFVF